MARGTRRLKVSPDHRRRIERAFPGLTYEQVKQRGLSLQAARGHRPTVNEAGVRVGGEKKGLEARRRERGELSDRERAYLRQQIRLDAGWRSEEDKAKRREAARRVFTAMSPERRAEVMTTQRELARGYVHRKNARRRAKRAAARSRRGAGGQTVGGGGGPLGADYGGFYGATGGGGGTYYVGSGEEDFSDWYGMDFPEIDEDSDLLLYYH